MLSLVKTKESAPNEGVIVQRTCHIQGFPFAEQAQSVELAPLTFITGPNGGGKSCLLRHIADGAYEYAYSGGDRELTQTGGLRGPSRTDYMYVGVDTPETLIGVAAALGRIARDDEAKRRFSESVLDFAPWLCAARIEMIGMSRATCRFYRYDGSSVVQASEPLAKGLVRFAFFAALTYDPIPSSLICIDKPEVGLDWTARRKVAEMLVELSAKAQVCVTTYDLDMAHHTKTSRILVCNQYGDRVVCICRCKVCLAREETGWRGTWNRLVARLKQ